VSGSICQYVCVCMYVCMYVTSLQHCGRDPCGSSTLVMCVCVVQFKMTIASALLLATVSTEASFHAYPVTVFMYASLFHVASTQPAE